MMRNSFIIGGLILGAISVDLLLAMIRPIRWLPNELCADVGSAGMNASLFLIPAVFVFWPAKSPSGPNWLARIVLSSLTSWYATLQFRMQFNLPALREIAYQSGDYMYDGVGMNAALLATGWIPPLFLTIVLVALYSTFARRAKATHDGLESSRIAGEAPEP
ncbi:hypothetical protein [Stieleria maiorica]|nr:hypothetical protein [Stieleria maiorica]